MFFNQYPYINLNDFNLDYLLKAIGKLQNDVTNFVSVNAIKYANPIQWDITRQYEKNTIVIDPVTGTAYISVAPVPVGVALTRDEYWTVVFDLGQFVVRAAKNFTDRYESETTLTATFPTTAGDWLVWGDTLYRATTNITAGDTYVVGGNIVHFTMETETQDIRNIIGLLSNLNTTDKTNVVAAINEIVATVTSAISRLDDTDNNIITRINNYKIRNVLEYGAVGDGTTDDSAAIASALDDDIVLYFPPEHTFIVNQLVIDKNNVTITGGGRFKGQIIARAPWPNNGPLNLFITGMIFDSGNPILIDRGVSIRIFENRFYNVEKAITISPTGAYDTSSYSHVVEDLNIESNYVYMCDYLVYSDLGSITGITQDYLYMGDMSIINNQVKVAKITHVHVANCDGCIIANNVFYHFGSTSRVATKRNCINFYNWIAGALIEGNRLFESGREAIILFNATGCTINDNHIVQPGQCALTSAILIDSHVASGQNIVISNNHIYAPSKFGIELQNAVDVMAINNFVYNPVSDYGYYGNELGQPSMDSVTHYVVNSVTASGINYTKIFAHNFASNPSILYHGFVNSYMAEQVKTASDVFDIDDASIINCNPSTAITISTFDTSHLSEGQEVTIIAYNDNVTIASGSTIRLKGGTNYAMPRNSILVLKYASGILWEITRTET